MENNKIGMGNKLRILLVLPSEYKKGRNMKRQHLIILATLTSVILAISMYGCKKEQPVREDSVPPKATSLEDESYKHTKIAFVSNREGNCEIYTMNVDGTELTRLTNNPRVDGYPSWSPDGGKIVFRSYRNENLDIYVMNADGSERKNISNNPADDFEPSWSPFLDSSK